MDTSALRELEPRLRTLLPAMLYADAWTNPSAAALERVFDHLRTLRYVLQDYVPRYVAENPAQPGIERGIWQDGALMFTDLAGFTTLVEVHAAPGQDGAAALLAILNRYFATMVEIISKSGGNLLEWTGDAMLVQFSSTSALDASARAIRAGLRMQRAMSQFVASTAAPGAVALGMRIGIHAGRYLAADVGTPRRMEYVLLGSVVLATKEVESHGSVGQVCLSAPVQAAVGAEFRTHPAATPGYWLVQDDLPGDELGEYDIQLTRRRQPRGVLLDRSRDAVLEQIASAVPVVEALASYLPAPVLNLLVESAAERRVPAQFVELPVIFVNLRGLTNLIDDLPAGDEAMLLQAFSRCFASINAAVETRGGILKNITYDRIGSTILIYFGAVNAHTDDALRAAHTARLIVQRVQNLAPFVVAGQAITAQAHVGVAFGPAFAAEVGEPRGRREFNLLGDVVNIAARLMARAGPNQIMINAPFARRIAHHFDCPPLGELQLKGKRARQQIFELPV